MQFLTVNTELHLYTDTFSAQLVILFHNTAAAILNCDYCNGVSLGVSLDLRKIEIPRDK